MSEDKIDYVGVGGAVGGVLGSIGILLNWWSYSFPVRGGVITVGVGGLEDWTGRAAMAASIAAFAFGGAHLLMDDPRMRKITGGLMGAGAIFLLAMTVLGMFRAAEAVGPSPLVMAPAGSVVTFTTGLTGGIFISMMGGLVALVATIMMIGQGGSPETSGTV